MFEVDRDRVRVWCRPPGEVSTPVLTQNGVHQRRFAGIGTADDGDMDAAGAALVVLLGFVVQLRKVDIGRQRVEQVAQPFAMLGRDRDRVAQPQTIGLADAGNAGAALGLVGDQDDRRLLLAQIARDQRIERGDTLACVDDEQHDVGVAHRLFGLAAHPRLHTGIVNVLQPGRVDDAERRAGQHRIGLAAVTGDARLIVDDRQALAAQAVEESRFPDIGPADDRHDRQFA